MKRFVLLRFISILLVFILLAGCSNTQPAITKSTDDATTQEATIDPVLAERRALVLEKMEWMQSIIWTPSEDITYTRRNGTQGVEFDDPKYVMTFYAGQLYRGVPYTHGSASGEAFLDYAIQQDENGVYTIDGLTTAQLSGDDNYSEVYTARIGNDCADALFWSWSQISPSITFTKTTTSTQAYGCLPVGNYSYTEQTHKDSKAFCESVGADVMCEAYALLQPGDGVVSGPDGHAMMIRQVVVEYTADGKIDPLTSYIETVHQNINKDKSYFDEELGQTVYCCGFDVGTFYFYKLYSSGYLPITCKELIDPAPIPDAVAQMSNSTPSLDTLFLGTVTCNYRISDVTVSIADSSGEILQQSTCYGREAEMYVFDLSRFTLEQEQPYLRGTLQPEILPSGTYTVTYTCRTAHTDPITLGTFDFTV